jgi:hypothetical protein
MNFVQREDLVARAKIGLNMKQTESWLYPSNSRYHYHLSNDSLLVSEHCAVPCDLSPYIIEADQGAFVQRCYDVISSGDWANEARERRERLMTEMPMPPLMASLLDATFNRC